jgi:cytochrome c biogenesis protein CcmG/thiol:disulfide interchange protein DsbE
MKGTKVALLMVLSVCLVAFAEPAPDFTLKDLAGKDVTLSALKGKIVVIDFWATWCAACKEAFGELNAISTEMGSGGVVVVGVNLEKINPQKAAAFVKKAGITYTVALDPEMATAKSFGVKGVPSLVVIDKSGAIAKMFRGMNKATEKEISALLKSLIEAK